MSKTRRSICFINPTTIFNTIGGAEVQASILANEALRKEWRISFLTRPDQIPAESIPGLSFIPFQELDNPEKNLQLFSEIVHSIDADVYYQRGRKEWTWLTAEALKRENNKVFVYAASMDLDCVKYKYIFRRSGSLRENYKNFKNFFTDLKEDRNSLLGINQASLVLAQTKSQQEKFKRNLEINSTIFPNIHPVPDHDSLIKKNPPVVLWLASVKEWKQPAVFMKLAKDLVQMNCEFILAGQMADPRYLKPVMALQASQKNFTYIPEVDLDKSNELIAESTLFINTSRSEEGFPNTFIQAWLRETPTLTLHFDPDNIIEREKLGARAGNYQKLRQHVIQFLENRDMSRETGKRARQYAVSAHGVPENIDRFFSLLNDIQAHSDH